MKLKYLHTSQAVRIGTQQLFHFLGEDFDIETKGNLHIRITSKKNPSDTVCTPWYNAPYYDFVEDDK
jgi:hypothetical protein